MLERFNPNNWVINWDLILSSGIYLGLAILGAYIVFRVILSVLKRVTKDSETKVDELIVDRIRSPLKWSLIAIAVTVAAQTDPALRAYWEPVARFIRPALLGWIGYNVIKGVTATLEINILQDSDPIAARSRLTRLQLLSRIAVFAIVLVALGLMLYSIPAVRAIGTTMLASAGLAALVIGAAAQPALKSLIAGIQVALTEPVRIGDLVKVDNHVGRVEQMKVSFVTLRTWEEKVIVIPTSRFLDESFENWSGSQEQLTGPVILHLDPSANVEPIRAEFNRYLETHDLFDGRHQATLLTETWPESIEVRLSMSAKTIADLWVLRCDVREHMMVWLRENMDDALIRHRLEVPHGHPKAGEP